MYYNIDNKIQAAQVAQYPLNGVVYHDISFDISHLATLPVNASEEIDAPDEAFTIVIGKMV